MIQSDTAAPAGARNHPLAVRMGIIAAISQNMTIATIWGTVSVLLLSIEARLHITRELSTLGAPLMTIVIPVLAPIVGTMVVRKSLRGLMVLGALLLIAGFLLLGLSANYPLFLAAYGAFLAPGMVICGVVAPATLVTRWFVVNRGKAMGLVHVPLVIVIMPPLATWFLQHYGLPATYLALAGLIAVTILPASLLVVSKPPLTEQQQGDVDAGKPAPAEGGVSNGEILRSPRFWAYALCGAAFITGAVAITTHMIPMAEGWKLSAAQGATLLSIQSLVGIAGSLAFGWIADRLGGGRTFALMAFDCALLWGALLFDLPFPAVALIVGLIGVHGAATIPVLAVALSEAFGQDSFSKAYGLSNTVTLPFSVIGIVGGSMAYKMTGSYAPLLMGMAIFFVIVLPLALTAHRGKQAAAAV